MESNYAFTTNFATLDWVIVIIYLIATVGIGLIAKNYIKDMTDFVVAGRSIKSYLAIATMLGSEIGLVTVMYTAQKGFNGGFSAFHIGIAAGAACFLIGISGFIVVPLRKTGVMTIPEYYEMRFGRGVRIVGGAIMVTAGIMNMGMFLKASAIFLTELTGMADPVSLNWVMTILTAIVLVYTIIGGMVSVVITDYVQFVLLAFAMLGVSLLGIYQIGWEPLVETVKTVHGAPGFDPLNQDGFGITYVVWMFFTFGLVSCGVWPTAVARVLAAENERVVRHLFVWSSIGFMTRFIIPQFLGICALAWLAKLGPTTGYFTAEGLLTSNSDETLKAMPRYLAWAIPSGGIGLFAAGMLAAMMSTHCSYLLCWATSIVEDVVNPMMNGKLTMQWRMFLTRSMIFLVGVFLLAWSIWYPMEQDLLDYLAVSAGIYATGAVALLVLGLYWAGASRVGAYWALFSGLFAIVGLTPVRKFLHITNAELGLEINEAQIGLGTTALAVAAMVVGSLLFPDRTEKS
ncbi:MAG: sodium:solute symporter family protein [Pirellulaceae bacterium]|nr:sodium:solute symporter family protein [Pirellulaceae bacterium]